MPKLQLGLGTLLFCACCTSFQFHSFLFVIFCSFHFLVQVLGKHLCMSSTIFKVYSLEISLFSLLELPLFWLGRPVKLSNIIIIKIMATNFILVANKILILVAIKSEHHFLIIISNSSVHGNILNLEAQNDT